MKAVLDGDVLRAFMGRFAGYGNPAAPLWFVGMEEGSGQGIAELSRRVLAWDARGRRVLEDLPSYHHAIGLPRHFVPPFPLQRTWAPLLRILMAWRGVPATLADLRRAQASELGTPHGDSALVELLPLPAPGLAHWPYGALASQLPELADRGTYAEALRGPRITLLRALLMQTSARVVVCYGLGYTADWTQLVGATLEERITKGQRWLHARRGATHYVVVPHPVARGTPRDFWAGLGREVRAR